MRLSVKRKARYVPQSPRLVVSVNSVFLLPDDRETSIEIHNISRGGFLAATDDAVPVDTWLGVNIPGRGIVRAQVRWFKDGILGAQFARPLTLQEVITF